MADRKTVAKSVRMTESVAAVIEAAPGKGFNEKFENYILRSARGEGEREQRIAELDKQINDKLHQIYKLYDTYRYLDSYYRNFDSMKNTLDAMRECIHEASLAYAQAKID